MDEMEVEVDLWVFGGGGSPQEKSNESKDDSILCHRFFSKTKKTDQNYLLKAEIKNITNCSSQTRHKGSLDKWNPLCYQLRIINLFIIFNVSKR